MPIIAERIAARATLHEPWQASDPDAALAEVAPRIRALVITLHAPRIDDAYIRFPKLEIVSSFGVGYDHIDAKAWAGARGIVVAHHAGRARRGNRRHRDGADDRTRCVASAAGRTLSARRALAEGGPVPADGVAARANDGRSGSRPHRQGDRQARGAPSASTSSITAASRRTTRPISTIPRCSAWRRRRYSDGRGARRRGHAPHRRRATCWRRSAPTAC